MGQHRMKISRRRFLGTATGAAAGLVATVRGAANDSEAPAAGGRVILDAEDGCGLRESLAGYQAALAGAGFRVVRAASDLIPQAATIVVPGCARLDPRLARALAGSLDRGGLVLLESAAGFSASDGSPAFEVHRRELRASFGLEIEAPVDLWADCPAGRVPYVDYSWPAAVKVRDFSRVLPLASRSQVGASATGEVIGWAGGWPVALRRPAGRGGKGMLVFLGSPVGPALGAGDREARHWLRTLVAASSRSADLGS